ncbi:orotidine-5'-phosphate decarboxylase [Aureimonas fodinaquatilis]|uniref:Orotidine 5'-phosphate decarboxylase n=1 Tax=Aureimonas fodinaquatilis TaxID=2565783 RepID=A0A5B0DQ09_9HYPH|nr:orotidine-5'-phosphate decarboxylase [Aureimonas fodinaquatilis]KAA0968503.1 orotidine-5'-phosphate decarboxylase [Aureimonas fodinaquatilis]
MVQSTQAIADDRLIVGLDLPDRAAAQAMVELLGDSVSYYKIGFQLALAGGLPLVRELADAGKKVFLDMKLLDIANTVEKGVESALGLGASMLTIHAYPQVMRAAAKAAQGTDLTVLGVTVLTSMNDADLTEAGYSVTVSELVAQRARQAQEAGIGGLVASAEEAGAIRNIVGPHMALVTPGIRPAFASADDQKRIVTPADALARGASHLVVARPVLRAQNPREAVAAILAEMR